MNGLNRFLVTRASFFSILLLISISAGGSVTIPERDRVASNQTNFDESANEAKACKAFEPPKVGVGPVGELEASGTGHAIPDLLEAFQNIVTTGYRPPTEVSPNVPFQLAELLRSQTSLDECNRSGLEGSVLCYGSGGLHLQPNTVPSVTSRTPTEAPIIVSDFRPVVRLQRDMEKGLTPDETEFAGRHFHSRAEVRAYIESPNYRDGVYSGLIVRDEDGNDSPIMVARIPHDPADIQKELWAGHLAAVRLYMDTHGGKEPYVVGAFECLLGYAGEQVEIINAAGTYRFENHSAQYSSDVLHAFGFERDARTQVKKLEPGTDPFFGHMRAREMSQHHAAIDRIYPGAIGEFRRFLHSIFERYPEIKSSDLNATHRKLFRFATAQPPSRTPEQFGAYRDLMGAIRQYREGSLGLVYLYVKRIEQIGTLEEALAQAKAADTPKADAQTRVTIPDDPHSAEAQTMARMRKYMPFFLEEFLGLP